MVALQNNMDLLKVEFGSCSNRYAASTVNGNDANCGEAERVLDITGEVNQDQTTITAIETDTNVSCLPVLSVTHISCSLCPEWPACVSVYPCETNTLI
jgi:hypothetical protein